MSVFVESNIEFDFTKALSVIPHDKPSGHGNSTWRGIDFCVEDAAIWIWLEVKSWDPIHIDPHRRGGQRRSFLCKIRGKQFAIDMRSKFIATTAFLAWTNQFPLAPTVFVLLLEPPKPVDAALLLAFGHRMHNHIYSPRWAHMLSVAVMDLNEWNARFPDYPARKI